MTDFTFPNESEQYRAARRELLELEKELRAKVDEVAARRRRLPLGGRLKHDYRFQVVDEKGRSQEVSFEDLFGSHSTLLVYTMMYGPEWDAACPSCTSLVDAFNANYFPLSQRCAMAVVSAARPEQLRDWAARRGWGIPLYSAGDCSYILDYFPVRDVDDPAVVSMMNVFRKTGEGVFHTWGSELVAHPKENGHPCHVDTVWPFWNLLDMTPEGRGDAAIPSQDYEHDYFTRKIYPGEDKEPE